MFVLFFSPRSSVHSLMLRFFLPKYTGLSARVYKYLSFRHINIDISIYIYIIYTPNLGSGIACPGREKEQSRFKRSTEGVRGNIEGASREHRGSRKGRSKMGEVLALQ